MIFAKIVKDGSWEIEEESFYSEKINLVRF